MGGVALVVLIALSILFRIPTLANPEFINSDHAFLGLQAKQMSQGHWYWFLWGSGYQTAWEPLIAMGFFRLFGTNYSSLVWVPFSAFLFALSATFLFLARTLGIKKAVLLVLLWVVAYRIFFEVNLFPYRQWSILFILASFLTSAWNLKPNSFVLFLSGFLAFFALVVDLFTLQFLPALLGTFYVQFSSNVAWTDRRRALFAGLSVGFALFLTFKWLAPAGRRVTALSLNPFHWHWALFFKTCFPISIGMDWNEGLWNWPHYFIGSYLFAFCFLGWCKGWFTRPEVPQSIRAAGVFGLLVIAGSSFSFLLGRLPIDSGSARYLVGLFFGLPFALAPVIYRIRFSQAVALLMPYLLVTAFVGWRQQSYFLEDSFRVRRDPEAWVERAKKMGKWMKSNGVLHGYADYWTSYRLSFLFDESPIIVPRCFWSDRYPLYRESVSKAPVVAEVFLPSDKPEMARNCEEELKRAGILLDKWQDVEFIALLRKNTGTAATPPLSDNRWCHPEHAGIKVLSWLY